MRRMHLRLGLLLLIAVAAGEYHTCALTTAGSVRCWRHNSVGQLGDATTTNRWTPVNVSDLIGSLPTMLREGAIPRVDVESLGHTGMAT